MVGTNGCGWVFVNERDKGFINQQEVTVLHPAGMSRDLLALWPIFGIIDRPSSASNYASHFASPNALQPSKQQMLRNHGAIY